jgi:hypothetical protein
MLYMLRFTTAHLDSPRYSPEATLDNDPVGLFDVRSLFRAPVRPELTVIDCDLSDCAYRIR